MEKSGYVEIDWRGGREGEEEKIKGVRGGRKNWGGTGREEKEKKRRREREGKERDLIELKNYPYIYQFS